MTLVAWSTEAMKATVVGAVAGAELTLMVAAVLVVLAPAAS